MSSAGGEASREEAMGDCIARRAVVEGAWFFSDFHLQTGEVGVSDIAAITFPAPPAPSARLAEGRASALFAHK